DGQGLRTQPARTFRSTAFAKGGTLEVERLLSQNLSDRCSRGRCQAGWSRSKKETCARSGSADPQFCVSLLSASLEKLLECGSASPLLLLPWSRSGHD